MTILRENNCYICGDRIDKDHIALNKKLINRQVNRFMCLVCMADFFSCAVEDLLVKIEEFKEQGCTLF